MYKTRVKLFKLHEVFKNQIGNSKYTKYYCNNHKGNYPVYTGTTIGDFGFINTFDYDTPQLTYTTDGEYAGTVKLLDGKFNVGGHRALLIPLVDGLDLRYFEYKLQSLFFNLVKDGDVPSLSWGLIKDIEIPLVITNDNQIDFEYQNHISNKLSIINKLKGALREKLSFLKNSNLSITDDEDVIYTSISINDMFDLNVNSNSSKFTKTYIRNNQGDIPVYGASKDDSPSYGYVRDNAKIVEFKNGKIKETKIKYFSDCLTYNIDGLAGYIFYREGRFSISEKVRPLIINDKYIGLVNPMYLKIILEPIFRDRVKGRLGNNGKNEYSKLNLKMLKDIMIKLPTNKEGYIDLNKQNDLVNQHLFFENIKKQIFSNVEDLLNVDIILD